MVPSLTNLKLKTVHGPAHSIILRKTQISFCKRLMQTLGVEKRKTNQTKYMPPLMWSVWPVM